MNACNLIIVADSSRARFFCTGGSGKAWTEVVGLDHAEARAHNRDLISDRPGRAFDSVGGGRHAMAERTDPRQHEAEVFAREVVRQLSANPQLSQCDQIAVVAPPRFLGLLRANLVPPIGDRVSCEVGKNLVTRKPDEIRRHLPRGW